MFFEILVTSIITFKPVIVLQVHKIFNMMSNDIPQDDMLRLGLIITNNKY
jgi:hypothetical protein